MNSSLHLPQDNHVNATQLIRALQSDEYLNVRKRDEVQSKSLLLLNEYRRKKLHLPALTPVDYNCIERAVMKLRLIVECLMVSKQMSGNCLLSRDVILGKMLQSERERIEYHRKKVRKQSRIQPFLL